MARKKVSSARALPARASLEYLRKLAKKRLVSLRAEDSGTKLTAAQLHVARDFGFKSWRALKAHIDSLTNRADAFLRAVGEGDVAKVSSMIAGDPALTHANGKHPFWGGRPQALHVTVERGHEELFKLLLDSGADPNGHNEPYSGWSPLMLAIHWKRNTMRKALLAAGATVGLAEALMLGDNKAVRSMLRNDPNVLTRPMPSDATPLHFVHTVRSAELLIEAGVPLNEKDEFDRTPLEAIGGREKANRELINCLIKHGGTGHAGLFAAVGDLPRLKVIHKENPDLLTRVHTVGLGPVTPLHAAVEYGHLATVRWLLNQGVPVNITNPNGATPLHSAAWHGRLKIAQLLIKHGADPKARDKEHDNTPLGWAKTCVQMLNRPGCAEVAQYLETLENPVAKTKPKKKPAKADWKPIMDAAYHGKAQRIKELVKQGADPNVLSATAHRHRPLHRAIEFKKTYPRTKDHVDAVRALLEGGADPKQRASFDQLTALQLAATGETRFVPILIDHFKPLDIFHAAVTCDSRRVAAILKRDEQQATKSDENDMQPLHYCAASAMFANDTKLVKAQLRITEQLLDAGADVNATFIWGGSKTPWPISVLYKACGKHNNPALTELLLNRGANMYDGESIYHATDEDHQECLAVLERFANKRKLAKEVTMCLRTQLHWGRSRGMKWQLAHGADPNDPDPKTGNTALHEAAHNGSSAKVIRALLDHGASPIQKNKAGLTPIEVAKKAKKTRVVDQLKKA